MNKKLMKLLGFGKEVEAVEQGRCPFCGKPIDPDEFRDKESWIEYNISGLCQECQDEMFGR